MKKYRQLNFHKKEKIKESTKKIISNLFENNPELKRYTNFDLRDSIARRCTDVLAFGYQENINNWESNIERSIMCIFPSYIPTKIQEEIKNKIIVGILEEKELQFIKHSN